MKTKQKLLTGIGVLAFMALLALNVQLVNSSQGGEAGFASLSLVELAVQAQTEGDCNCDPGYYCASGVCYPDQNSNNGLIDVRPCPDGGFWYTCGGTGNNCASDDC